MMLVAPLELATTHILHDQEDALETGVVDDIEELYDVVMSALLHNSNFLANLVLCAADLVGQRRIAQRANRASCVCPRQVFLLWFTGHDFDGLEIACKLLKSF